MPDNSAAIAQIVAILATGLKSAAADGESAAYDPDSMRQELSRLRATDTTGRGKRPFATTINLGGFR